MGGDCTELGGGWGGDEDEVDKGSFVLASFILTLSLFGVGKVREGDEGESEGTGLAPSFGRPSVEVERVRAAHIVCLFVFGETVLTVGLGSGWGWTLALN